MKRIASCGAFPLCTAIILSAVGCGGATDTSLEQTTSATATSAPAEDSFEDAELFAELPAPKNDSEILTVNFEREEEDDDDGDDSDLVIQEPQRGSPEWYIREITRLRIQAPEGLQPDGKLTPVAISEDQAAANLKRRNLQIIDLATQAIAATHQDSEKTQIFNNAVHYLTETRMQLALEGDQDQQNQLLEDAEALYQRDKTSFAASTAASRVLQLSQVQAQRYAAQDPRWALAFARQARLFGEKFPQESSRTALSLMTAGKLCESAQLDDEARACFALVEKQYAGTPYADQVSGTLRRLRLVGQPLQEFGGSTQDGGYTSIQDYKGKAVLIAFWASNSARFQEELPRIQETLNKLGPRVAAIGVNMDRDEVSMDQLLERTGNNWKHIFYSDPEKRGARNTVARYYDVTSVPLYWVVDSQGIVKSIDAKVEDLESLLK